MKIWELTPDGWWANMGKSRRLANLTLSQLEDYGLDNLLDIYPDNEAKLIASSETWQIAAFADLYAQKFAETGFPKKEDYERADRLYRVCFANGMDNAYFEKKLADLAEMWKTKMK